jgi:hypothetical protein
MDPVSLDAKRKEKAPTCEICGGPAHKFAGQCPRVHAITYEDGAVTYHLTEEYEPPPSAA